MQSIYPNIFDIRLIKISKIIQSGWKLYLSLTAGSVKHHIVRLNEKKR